MATLEGHAAAPLAPPDRPDVHPGAPEGVRGALGREGHRFAFFQAMWLLENMLADGNGAGADPEAVRVQVRPDDTLAFPAADVKRVEWTGETAARMTVTFMGLYGVDAPLPFYFRQSAAGPAEEAGVLRDFLDVFNPRLYALLYQAWKKYRPALHAGQADQNVHTRVFMSLAGLGTPGALDALPGSSLRLAAFAGLLGGRARNAAGLEDLLGGFLDGLPVRVVEHVPRWVPVADRPGLGRRAKHPAALGVNLVMGPRVLDVSGKFRLVVGPLTLEAYNTFLPGGARARLTEALVRLYVPDFLDFDVELLLDAAEATPLRLGDRKTRMGRNAWISRPSGTVVSEVVRYA